MIGPIISFTEMQAQDIHGLAQLVGNCGTTILVQREEGISSGYVVLRSLENGRAMICYKTKPLRVVANIQDWDTLSQSERIDIEWELMEKSL